MSSDRKQILDSEVAKFSHRMRHNVSKVSSSLLTETFKKCRELLSKSENKRLDFDNSISLSDDDYFNLTGISKDQFDYTCSMINGLRNSKYSVRTTIGVLLTKLRTGLSSCLLKTMFNVKCNNYICKIVRRAREALMKDFVPKYMGFDHITREAVIENHTTVFARELLASGDDNTAILLIDGTYIYILKKVENTHFSGNHTACTRGGLSLNPCLLLHLTGISLISWVLIWQKAKTLNKHLSKKQCNNILKWSQSNAVLVLDRGFRDSLDLIDSLNLRSESPSFLGKGQKQHTEAEANTSRLVTKIRWAVESANGRLKRWRILANVVTNTQIPFIGDYVRIVGSIINAFRPSLASDSDKDIEISPKMLEKSKLVINPLKEMFVKSGKRIVSNKMKKNGRERCIARFYSIS